MTPEEAKKQIQDKCDKETLEIIRSMKSDIKKCIKRGWGTKSFNYPSFSAYNITKAINHMRTDGWNIARAEYSAEVKFNLLNPLSENERKNIDF